MRRGFFLSILHLEHFLQKVYGFLDLLYTCIHTCNTILNQ